MSGKAAIVPASGPLSWGAIAGRAEVVAAKDAPKRTTNGTIAIDGRVIKHGELRAVTRAEETAATYGLDQASSYESAGIDQINAIDRVAEAWAKHQAQRVERPQFSTASEAVHTVTADLHNVGSLLGNLLFGE